MKIRSYLSQPINARLPQYSGIMCFAFASHMVINEDHMPCRHKVKYLLPLMFSAPPFSGKILAIPMTTKKFNFTDCKLYSLSHPAWSPTIRSYCKLPAVHGPVPNWLYTYLCSCGLSCSSRAQTSTCAPEQSLCVWDWDKVSLVVSG